MRVKLSRAAAHIDPFLPDTCTGPKTVTVPTCFLKLKWALHG